jgi:hypothetical protein
MEASEIHRLKPMRSDYDVKLFNKLYKKLRPLVRRLASNVDPKRFNVSSDIIESYFWDKFIYVFNKYEEYDENHMQAVLINSLKVYKNRLLRKAYTEQAEYNQNLASLEVLFDDSKELLDTSDEEEAKEEQLNALYDYMKKNLSPDGYLVFITQLDPPAYIRDLLRTDNSKITTIMLIDFFGLKRTKANSNYISKLRKEIEEYTQKARTELK